MSVVTTSVIDFHVLFRQSKIHQFIPHIWNDKPFMGLKKVAKRDSYPNSDLSAFVRSSVVVTLKSNDSDAVKL